MGDVEGSETVEWRRAGEWGGEVFVDEFRPYAVVVYVFAEGVAGGG